MDGINTNYTLKNRSANIDLNSKSSDYSVEEIRLESPIISNGNKCYSCGDITNNFTKNKRLILCLDGTENGFDLSPNTNVLKLFKMLEKDEPDQVCYYQPGVGMNFMMDSDHLKDINYSNSSINKLVSKVDSMVAFTLERHVLAAYKFLMKFYNHGDKIYIIGFRGSFTGRVLAGMIERVGLLNKGLEDMTSTAWRLYCNWEDAGQPAHNDDTISLVAEFKNTFSMKDVKIHFMGLWDSVNSVGVIRDRLFPYTIRSSIVEHVRHAVSIDERRSKYKQVLFQPYSYYPLFFHRRCKARDEVDDSNISNKSFNSLTSFLQNLESTNSYTSLTSVIRKFLRRKNKKRLTDLPSDDIIELFFAGNHGDCGGGWPPDLSNQNLSDIPLRWILSQALKFGIKFRQGSLSSFNHDHPVCESLMSCHHDLLSLKKNKIKMHNTPTSGFSRKILLRKTKKSKLSYQEIVEQVESAPRIDISDNLMRNVSKAIRPDCQLNSPKCAFDARGNESLIFTLIWWLIELIPAGYKIEDKDGKWTRIYVPNFGRSRKLPKNAKLHWSVFYRLHYISDYSPNNLPKNLSKKFIDSLSDHMSLYNGIPIEQFANNLTIDKIKNDWETNVWSVIPDDLQQFLEKNPNL